MEEITYKELRRKCLGNVYPKVRTVALDEEYEGFPCLSVMMFSTVVLFEDNKELYATRFRLNKNFRLTQNIQTDSRNYGYYYQKAGEEFHQELLQWIPNLSVKMINNLHEMQSTMAVEFYKIKDGE